MTQERNASEIICLLTDEGRKKDQIIKVLKHIIRELIAAAEEYTMGFNCICCGEISEQDDDGNEQPIHHSLDCWLLAAKGWCLEQDQN
jgi:hypothetical protein